MVIVVAVAVTVVVAVVTVLQVRASSVGFVSRPTHWVPINIRFHVRPGSGPFDCPRVRSTGNSGCPNLYLLDCAPRGVCVICYYKHARQAGRRTRRDALNMTNCGLSASVAAPASKHFEPSVGAAASECECTHRGTHFT